MVIRVQDKEPAAVVAGDARGIEEFALAASLVAPASEQAAVASELLHAERKRVESL
jgi:hypothetical protein